MGGRLLKLGASGPSVSSEPVPAPLDSAGEQGVAAADLPSFEYADSNRTLTAGLAGTVVVMLTFVLIFLYDRAASGAINSVLFRVTLLNVVVTIFLLSVASVNYWFLMEALRSDHPRAGVYLRRADGCFAASLILLLLEPVLILFTIQIYDVAEVAIGLWVVSILVLIFGWRDVLIGSKAMRR